MVCARWSVAGLPVRMNAPGVQLVRLHGLGQRHPCPDGIRGTACMGGAIGSHHTGAPHSRGPAPRLPRTCARRHSAACAELTVGSWQYRAVRARGATTGQERGGGCTARRPRERCSASSPRGTSSSRMYSETQDSPPPTRRAAAATPASCPQPNPRGAHRAQPASRPPPRRRRRDTPAGRPALSPPRTQADRARRRHARPEPVAEAATQAWMSPQRGRDRSARTATAPWPHLAAAPARRAV